MRGEEEFAADGTKIYKGYCGICDALVYQYGENERESTEELMKKVDDHLKEFHNPEQMIKMRKEPEFHYDFHDEEGMTARGLTKMKIELTTSEIFEESMKLSDPAYKEKGEKLEQYKKWLKQRWRRIDDEE